MGALGGATATLSEPFKKPSMGERGRRAAVPLAVFDAGRMVVVTFPCSERKPALKATASSSEDHRGVRCSSSSERR